MRAARAAVKYWVVNQLKADGCLRAHMEEMTVHKGKSVVAPFAVFK